MSDDRLDAGRKALERGMLDLSAREARPLPARIGKYQLQAKVGHGGMGMVFRAVDTELNRGVALKILRGETAEDIERLYREARIAAKLRHPNIVAVHEVGEADGFQFIAMDLVDGQSLEAQALPVRRALEVMRDVARAVHHAHQQGVIHRDLKPGNILIGGDGRAYVTDFGLAKQTDVKSSMSVSGAIMGTPSYLSPEQAAGKAASADARSDVWGLGATLYELVTGRAPFEGETAVDVVLQVLQAEPPAPRRVNPKLHADIETVVMKCLEKEPGKRHATAGEVAEDLERYLEGEPIRAHPPGAWSRLRKSLAKRRGVLGVVLAAGLLAGLGVAWGLTARSRSRAYAKSKGASERAFAQGEWAAAEMEGRRALALRGDAELEQIVRESRANRETVEEATRRKLEEAKRYRRLRERLKPVEEVINDTRPFFYIEWVDIRAKLEKVEEELRKLEQDVEFRDHPDALTLIGVGWYFVGDITQAERALRRAEGMTPENGRVCFYLAKICVERMFSERVANAQDREKTYVEVAREQSLKARQYVGKASVGGTGAQETDRWLVEVYVAIAHGDEKAVFALCDEGIERYGRALGVEELYFLRGFANPDQSNEPEKAAWYSRAIEKRPHYPVALLMRGIARGRMGKYADAIADFEKALRANPRFAEAYRARGLVRHAKGDREGAMGDFSRAIELEPEYAHTYVTRAFVRGEMGDYKGAIADCTEAIRIAPKSSSAHFQRGLAKAALGGEDGALADFDEAVLKGSFVADLYVHRALIYEKRGESDRALSDLNKALELDPKWAVAWYYRGRVRFSKKDWRGASGDYGEAVRLQPAFPEAWASRGAARQNDGDLKGALEDYEKALQVAPPNWHDRKRVTQLRDDARRRLKE